MSENTNELIFSLNENQLLIACQSLILNLEEKFNDEDIKSFEIDLEKMNEFISSNPDDQTLEAITTLKSSNFNDAENSNYAQNLLMLAGINGFDEEVKTACMSAKEHVLDFGIVSSQLIFAGLMIILAWTPVKTETSVKKAKRKLPDGTEEEFEIIEEKVERAGPKALENLTKPGKILSKWWSSLTGR